jgi:hypothetical protein
LVRSALASLRGFPSRYRAGSNVRRLDRVHGDRWLPGFRHAARRRRAVPTLPTQMPISPTKTTRYHSGPHRPQKYHQKASNFDLHTPRTKAAAGPPHRKARHGELINIPICCKVRYAPIETTRAMRRRQRVKHCSVSNVVSGFGIFRMSTVLSSRSMRRCAFRGIAASIWSVNTAARQKHLLTVRSTVQLQTSMQSILDAMKRQYF